MPRNFSPEWDGWGRDDSWAMVAEEKPQPPQPLSVSGLLTSINAALAAAMPRVLVRGEIHALKAAMSGHLYLDLKDEQGDAIVHCCLWASRRRRLTFTPRQGDLVDVTGSLDMYAPRGSLSLVIDSMRPAGEGALWAQFLALKEKLAALGLFESERKKKLPAYPTVVGIVTSSWAAALRDVLRTLQARAPGVSVILYPAAVQGETAESELIAALQKADARRECDVILLVRGGGSLADLWTFNSEALANQIARMHIPVVSGVGHATDTSISDLVADATAVTPTAAAELITQNWVAAPQAIASIEARMTHRLQSQLQAMQGRLAGAQRLFPLMESILAQARFSLARQGNVQNAFDAYVGNLGRRLDGAVVELAGAPGKAVMAANRRFTAAAEQLQLRRPDIATYRANVPDEAQLRIHWMHYWRGRQERVQRCADTLCAFLEGVVPQRRERLEDLSRRLVFVKPATAKKQVMVERIAMVLAQLVRGHLRLRAERVKELAAQLRAMDAREVLKRGYAVVRTAKGEVVQDAQSLAVKESISLTFARGEAAATVTAVKRQTDA